MATISNIKQWMEASEPDYYMMFVKAFIPYNAWYMTNFYSEDDNRTNDIGFVFERSENMKQDVVLPLHE